VKVCPEANVERLTNTDDVTLTSIDVVNSYENKRARQQVVIAQHGKVIDTLVGNLRRSRRQRCLLWSIGFLPGDVEKQLGGAGSDGFDEVSQ